MNNNDHNNGSSGIGFLGLLAIVFITLKLCGVISWPWYLVLAPIWIPAAIVFVLAVMLLVIYKLK